MLYLLSLPSCDSLIMSWHVHHVMMWLMNLMQACYYTDRFGYFVCSLVCTVIFIDMFETSDTDYMRCCLLSCVQSFSDFSTQQVVYLIFRLFNLFISDTSFCFYLASHFESNCFFHTTWNTYNRSENLHVALQMWQFDFCEFKQQA